MPRGRPRSFDREIALQRALEVFWAKGYEAAQLTDLTAAMGINPPSFYAAFRSKEAAFREALELYERNMGEGWVKCLGDPDTHRSIRALLDYSIDLALSAPGPGGCMMVLSMINATSCSESLVELVRDRRQEGFRHVRQRLEKGVGDGDLPPSTEITRLADFYCTTIQAISLRARDGASKEELNGIAALAMMSMPKPAGR